MPKANKATIEQRTRDVYLLLLSGASRAEIQEYARNKWGLSRSAIDEYIEKANKQFEVESHTIRSKELGKAISRLSNLYKSAIKAQDYRIALAVQKELNTLLGLYAPAKVETEHSGAIQIEVRYTNEPDDND